MASVYILGARSAIKIMNGSIDYEHMGVLRFSTSAKGSSSMALDSESETRKPHFTATAKCRSSRQDPDWLSRLRGFFVVFPTGKRH